MTTESSNRSIKDDNRSVSEVIGFLLVFAILIGLLAINQAQFVPQENGEIEFQHFQEVRDDMIEIRSAISTAGQADVSQFPTVTLGTDYPPRLFAVNPRPSSGTISTSQKYDIWINESGATSKNVSTRFLEYRNGYREIDTGSIWYEHSVLYLDERDVGGSVAIYEDQNIITGDNSARVNALQNEFRVTSTGGVTLDLYPTKNTSINISNLSGNITLKIPTRLQGKEYWDSSIGDMNSNGQWEYHGTENHSEDGIWWLNLTIKADSLNFNTVGIDSAPEDSETASQGVGPGGESGGSNDGSTGDTGDEATFDFVSMDKSKGGEIKFTITNTDSEQAVITDVSLDMTSYGSYKGDKIKIDGDNNRKDDYNADGSLYLLNEKQATIDVNSESTITFKNVENKIINNWDLGDLNLVNATEDDWEVATTLKLKSGAEQTLYFKEGS